MNGALEHGYNIDRIHVFEEKVDVVQWLNKLVSHEKLGQDDVVLVKASRGLRFETIVAEIIHF
jgi:UDP-N-acetylmuramyl pentapeptide synthase